MKKPLILVLILVLIGIFVGTRLAQRPTHTDSVHELDRESVNRSIESVVTGYLYSQKTPLHLGDTMPILELPILRGNEPDWQKMTILTVGMAFSSSSQALHHQLKALNIQQIHVVDRGSNAEIHMDDFPDTVIFLDGTDNQRSNAGLPSSASSHPSRKAHELFGIMAISAYFFNEDRLILGAWVNGGGPPFENLGEEVIAYVDSGTQNWRQQNLLPIGQSLDLSLLPPDARAEIEKELKAITLIFISDPSICNICETFLSVAEPYLENWRREGYGLIHLESGHAHFTYERLGNGILRITDRPLNSHGESVASTWGVAAVPGTFLLQNGNVAGLVGWQSLTVEQGQHRASYQDLMFRAINEIVASDFMGD